MTAANVEAVEMLSNQAETSQASTNQTKNRVMVTGAAGFIGAHVCRWLLGQGYTVVAVDDFNDYYDPTLKTLNIEPFLSHPQFILYRADIRDAEALEVIFKQHPGLSAVIHLAARAGVRPSIDQPQLYMATNVQGTANLAQLASQYKAQRLVFASSSSVYGDAPEQVPFVETQDVSRPISPYAATKVMAEHWLHTYSHLQGLRVVALRFFTVYGPGQRPDLAIHKFTRLISDGQPVPFFGDGATRRDYTYIDDILTGIAGALRYEGPLFDIFNLGESQTTDLKTLVAMLENAIGKPAKLHYLPAQPGDVSVTYANIDKARRLLGYNPTTPVSIGIPRFVDWYNQYRAGQTLTPTKNNTSPKSKGLARNVSVV
jgi:UDP-glucuronate 4-epimerase